MTSSQSDFPYDDHGQRLDATTVTAALTALEEVRLAAAVSRAIMNYARRGGDGADDDDGQLLQVPIIYAGPLGEGGLDPLRRFIDRSCRRVLGELLRARLADDMDQFHAIQWCGAVGAELHGGTVYLDTSAKKQGPPTAAESICFTLHITLPHIPPDAFLPQPAGPSPGNPRLCDVPLASRKAAAHAVAAYMNHQWLRTVIIIIHHFRQLRQRALKRTIKQVEKKLRITLEQYTREDDTTTIRNNNDDYNDDEKNKMNSDNTSDEGDSDINRIIETKEVDDVALIRSIINNNLLLCRPNASWTDCKRTAEALLIIMDKEESQAGDAAAAVAGRCGEDTAMYPSANAPRHASIPAYFGADPYGIVLCHLPLLGYDAFFGYIGVTVGTRGAGSDQYSILGRVLLGEPLLELLSAREGADQRPCYAKHCGGLRPAHGQPNYNPGRPAHISWANETMRPRGRAERDIAWYCPSPCRPGPVLLNVLVFSWVMRGVTNGSHAVIELEECHLLKNATQESGAEAAVPSTLSDIAALVQQSCLRTARRCRRYDWWGLKEMALSGGPRHAAVPADDAIDTTPDQGAPDTQEASKAVGEWFSDTTEGCVGVTKDEPLVERLLSAASKSLLRTLLLPQITGYSSTTLLNAARRFNTSISQFMQGRDDPEDGLRRDPNQMTRSWLPLLGDTPTTRYASHSFSTYLFRQLARAVQQQQDLCYYHGGTIPVLVPAVAAVTPLALARYATTRPATSTDHHREKGKTRKKRPRSEGPEGDTGDFNDLNAIHNEYAKMLPTIKAIPSDARAAAPGTALEEGALIEFKHHVAAYSSIKDGGRRPTIDSERLRLTMAAMANTAGGIIFVGVSDQYHAGTDAGGDGSDAGNGSDGHGVVVGHPQGTLAPLLRTTGFVPPMAQNAVTVNERLIRHAGKGGTSSSGRAADGDIARFRYDWWRGLGRTAADFPAASGGGAAEGMAGGEDQPSVITLVAVQPGAAPWHLPSTTALSLHPPVRGLAGNMKLSVLALISRLQREVLAML